MRAVGLKPDERQIFSLSANVGVYLFKATSSLIGCRLCIDNTARLVNTVFTT